VSLLVITDMVKQATRAVASRQKRNGIPHTVYFSEELTAALNHAAQARRVGKSTIIRIAIEELLRKLDSGQLELPLGL
jgi:Ribbon-helix-helix protein, copG family